MTVEVNKNLYELARNHTAPDRKNIVALEGGSRSGKTWSILEYLINCCLDMPGLVVTAFRHDQTTHTESTIRDFHAMMALNFRRAQTEGRWNGQEKKFTFANGSVFEFEGTSNILKLHGPARDIAWLNEVMEITLEAWDQIEPRTRLFTLIDWNPSFSHHWVFDKVLKRLDVLHVHSTFRNNPHLTDIQVAAILKYDPMIPANVASGTADRYMWDVYGLGRRGRREGTIYENWATTTEWPERMNCIRHGYGLDFGFSADPSALVECALFQSELYLREIVYESGLVIRPSESLPNLPCLTKRMADGKVLKTSRIHADCARPDLISELVMEGWNQTAACEKGEGSVLAGINLLRGFRLLVHSGSHNIQRELEQYAWKKNRQSGQITDEPEDKWNHAMDAIRYWAWKELKGVRTTAVGLTNHGSVKTRANSTYKVL